MAHICRRLDGLPLAIELAWRAFDRGDYDIARAYFAREGELAVESGDDWRVAMNLVNWGNLEGKLGEFDRRCPRRRWRRTRCMRCWNRFLEENEMALAQSIFINDFGSFPLVLMWGIHARRDLRNQTTRTGALPFGITDLDPNAHVVSLAKMLRLLNALFDGDKIAPFFGKQ